MSRLIIFMFAGRQANMEIQMPYLERILSQRPDSELHLWDLTRTVADARYLDSLEGRENGRVRVLRHLHGGHPIRCTQPHGRRMRGFPPCLCIIHKPPYEKPYEWYASQPEFDNATYVKIDDDVLFLETERFDYLVAPLERHPERVISASVINNVVCAKYGENAPQIANHFMVGDPALPKNDRRWWALHENAEFATWSHHKFLRNVASALDWDQPAYVRTRPGEAVSINCISFTQVTMRVLAKSFEHEPRLGDEGAVDRRLPWICNMFKVAHLSFGPQEKAMPEQELNSLRSDYAKLRDGYLP